MKNKIPPPIVTLVFAGLMWLVANHAAQFRFEASWMSWLSVVLLLAGISVAVLGVIQFNRAQTTVNPLKPDTASSLVTAGIFTRTRNPMYVGMLLVLIGWWLWLGSLLNLLLIAGFVVYMNEFQIKPEEQAMEKLFGAEFTAYKSRVRRWL